MYQRDDQIEQIFAGLGMASPGEAGQRYAPQGYGPQGYSPQDYAPQTAGPMAGLSSNAQMRAGQVPEGIEPGEGAMTQFLHGLTSPFRDTASGLGLIDPRPMPQGGWELGANIAGSILGWIGLTKITGGIGTVAAIGGKASAGLGAAGGAVASVAGKAGIGISQAAGTSMVKGATYGAASSAHWSWGQRDRPIGKDALYGMAFGTGFGIAGAGISRLAQSRGWTVPQTKDWLKQQLAQKTQGDHAILTTTDPDSMARALAHKGAARTFTSPEKRHLPEAIEQVIERSRQQKHPLPSTIGVDDHAARIGGKRFYDLAPEEQADHLVRSLRGDPQESVLLQPLFDLKTANTARTDLFKATGVAGQRIRAIVNKTGAFKPRQPVSDDVIKGLPKAQRGKEKFLRGKTFGEQEQGFREIRDAVKDSNRRMLEQHGPWKFLSPERRGLYANREAALQDMQWELGDHITKTLSLDDTVNLPPLGAVDDPAVRGQTLKTLKGLSEMPGQDLSQNVTWHWRLQRILEQENLDTGMSARHSQYLTQKGKSKWDQVWRELTDAGESPVIFDHPSTEILYLPETFEPPMIHDWVKNVKNIPAKQLATPTSIEQSIMMERPISPLMGLFQLPRKILGEAPARRLRFATSERFRWQNQQIDDFLDTARKAGLDSDAKRAGKGPLLYRALTRDIPDSDINHAVRRSTALLREATHRKHPSIHRAARESGISVEEARRSYDRLREIVDHPDTMENLAKIGRKVGRSADDLAESQVANYMYNFRLRKADALQGAALGREAKAFGLENADEMRMVSVARRKYDELFKKAGLPPEKYESAYAPRFRHLSMKDRKVLMRDLDEMGIPDHEVENILWVNEMSREGTPFVWDEDLFSTYSRYVSGLSKKLHYDTAIKDLNKHFDRLPVHDSRKDLYEGLKDWMVGRPHDIEKGLDRQAYQMMDFIGKSHWAKKWGPKPTAQLSALLADLQYTGAMAYNPWMPVRNLTQKFLSLSSITDDGNPLRGLKEVASFNIKKRQKGTLESIISQRNPVLHDRMYLEGQNLHYSAVANTLKKFGVSDKSADGVDRVLRQKGMSWFRWSDRSNVEDTFGARAKWLMEQKGAPLADAVELARQTTMATQFMYGFDSPMMYKTPWGRQLGLFQSWPINWAHMLWDQGTTGNMHRAISTVVMTAMGAEVLGLSGMNFRSIAPTEAARGILPIGALLEGEQAWPIALRTSSAITEYGRSLAAADDDAIDSALSNLSRNMAPLVPLGIMSQRAFKFIDRVRHDWRDFEDPGFLNIRGAVGPTREDQKRLRADVTPGESVRGLVGPTVEARQRIEDWQRASRMESNYRSLRKKAVNAFLDGEYGRFEQFQEQLVSNFGRWIEPHDIQQEVELRGKTARERQFIGMPEEITEPFLDRYGR